MIPCSPLSSSPSTALEIIHVPCTISSQDTTVLGILLPPPVPVPTTYNATGRVGLDCPNGYPLSNYFQFLSPCSHFYYTNLLPLRIQLLRLRLRTPSTADQLPKTILSTQFF